jgi:hypothetical protein
LSEYMLVSLFSSSSGHNLSYSLVLFSQNTLLVSLEESRGAGLQSLVARRFSFKEIQTSLSHFSVTLYRRAVTPSCLRDTKHKISSSRRANKAQTRYLAYDNPNISTIHKNDPTVIKTAKSFSARLRSTSWTYRI